MRMPITDVEKQRKMLDNETNDEILIRPSQFCDIDAMLVLSKSKRLTYEGAQPQFWRYAGESGDHAQKQWFTELLETQDYLMLTARRQTQGILGFVIGKIIPAPEVYNPGGLTLMIDDFCVQSENLWISVGVKLMEAIKVAAKAKGALQILVVCGAHDSPKRKFLVKENLSIASEWFVGGIGDARTFA